MELKYKDWSKVLIEPATLNDARVFSLESRITQEEDIRIKEFEFVKDLMKKLVYSLEQLSVQHLDHSKKQSLDHLDHVSLPRLLSSSPSRNADGFHTARASTKQPNTMDIMMVKRMNYIRNTLDQHDPREVTDGIRRTANKKKEQRLLDLWREDASQPAVSEIVMKMKKEKLAE